MKIIKCAVVLIFVLLICSAGCAKPTEVTQNHDNLPDGWPSDLLFADGFEIVDSQIDDEVMMINAVGEMSRDDVRDYYVSGMGSMGWEKSSVEGGEFEEEVDGVIVLHYVNDSWILGINMKDGTDGTELRFVGIRK